MLELCRGKIYNLPRLNSLSIKNWISPLNWNVQHWAGSSIKTRLGWSCQWLLEQSPRRKCWVTFRECCQFDTTLPDCHWICSHCAVKLLWHSRNTRVQFLSKHYIWGGDPPKKPYGGWPKHKSIWQWTWNLNRERRAEKQVDWEMRSVTRQQGKIGMT